LEKSITGIKTVFFTPTASLYKVSFAALPLGTNEVLSDRYQLVQLNSTASILKKKTDNLAVNDKITLYGGIQYDADSVNLKKAALKHANYDVVSRAVPENLLRDAPGEFYFLSGTEKEISGIVQLASENKFRTDVAKGIEATEESFKSLSGNQSPVVLHIATHGFFFADPKNEKKDELKSGAVVFRQSDNPLIRSGLAFAGANNTWKGNSVHGIEDGILTSFEVSNMYFPGTRLAVLSACETGLGEIQGSEGVYGFQRAFKIAGVENLVMSLWKVPDEETSLFMQAFYNNIFHKKSITDSFYDAQNMMKNKFRNEPFKWAAWVLVK
jgi:CHAT domain-containing protein